MKPPLILTDSIDLQERNAPSAQDHTKQQTHSSPVGIGPHQAEALRGVAQEAAEEQSRSPRVSREWSNGDVLGLQQHDDTDLAAAVTASLTATDSQKQDDLAVAQNGGLTGSTAEDAEMADAEGDDDVDEDDDMMDKISSSPSIDDGGYPLSLMWPQRSDSLLRKVAPISSPSISQACCESSSPYVEEPAHFPLRPLRDPIDKDVVPGTQVEDSLSQHHHLQGEYMDGSNDSGSEIDDVVLRFAHSISIDAAEVNVDDYDQENNLASDSDETHAELSEPEHSSETEDDEGIMTIPYEHSEDEDDDDLDISYTSDSRFIDSGWGGECLQILEDIDFEFVYALHTFVATVEGQANATKGDTMVLLDDSNSYWWLVRVVKDSSIGGLTMDASRCYGLLTLIYRIPTGGTYRNPDGKISTPEQTQKY